MKKSGWKTKITRACKAAGSFQPFFVPIIDTLAEILEKRDLAEEQFRAEGQQIVMDYTNKGGATNSTISPYVTVINALNRDALAYWRDLCLTPAAFKKLNEPTKVQVEKGPTNALAEALASLKDED